VTGLNRRPSLCKGAALPTELSSRIYGVSAARVSPAPNSQQPFLQRLAGLCPVLSLAYLVRENHVWGIVLTHRAAYRLRLQQVQCPVFSFLVYGAVLTRFICTADQCRADGHLFRGVFGAACRSRICYLQVRSLELYPDELERRILYVLVPKAGLEPALHSEPDFESGASTNSATWALVKSGWG
jgi:hypothetical protein